MKKAKNALAITGFVLAALAVLALLLMPCLDGIAASMSGGDSISIAERLSANFNEVFERVKMLFDFPTIFGDLGGHIFVLVVLGVGAVGLVLLLVLFVLMLAKKHAKGIGFWVPMLILFAASVLVAGVGLVKNPTFLGLGDDTYMKYTEIGFVPLIVLCVAGAAMALFVLAIVFYMAYVCKARKNQKKVDEAKSAAIAKIDALLGGIK